jgi:hypothetical protein
MKGSIIEIDYQTAINFLLPKHYSGRKPQITKTFGWYDCEIYTNEHLMAVCSFGKPASPFLCKGICGEQYKDSVYELNRLCRLDDWNEPLSQFVSACLRRLRLYNWIVVSFSDTAMNHHGYIYQACNFLYTGETKERTDKYTENGKHARHYSNDNQGKYRQVRSAKYRYVYFCTKNKRLKKEWEEHLNYPILPYPKGDNSEDYELGYILKPKIIKCDDKND